MLLQAACLARLGNMLSKKRNLQKHTKTTREESAGPIIVSAVYIDDDLCANWHLVYQPSAPDAAVG
jgi:hypothetical protein